MRIAIDGRALTGRFTGDRTYWRSLIDALPRNCPEIEVVVYTRLPIPAGETPQSDRIRVQSVHAPNDRAWTLLAFPMALRRDGADLAHVQYTAPPRLLCPCPIVTTVHDISFRLYPEWFPRKDRVLLNLTVPASMRAAARVITDSESSRADILRAYSLRPDHVVAIPLGVPEMFRAQGSPVGNLVEDLRARLSLPEQYILAVGVLQPRKNLKLLCEAFGRARARQQLPHCLVIAGKSGWSTDEEELRAAARRGGGEAAADAVQLVGYVPDSDLPALYRGADLFAYPSLYEGFGIPPIEAMACGTPVAVSDAPALPEVVGSAARIIPASDIEAWAQAIGDLLIDRDALRSLAAAGPDRAACFTWDKTARDTCAVYRSVLNPNAH